MIEGKNPVLSIKKQCRMLEISRSGYYYKPAPLSEFNLELMREIDKIYTESPEYGSRLVRDILRRNSRYKKVNRKRVQRLMRLMCIEAIYPKRNLSRPGTGSEHKIYPYLLKGLDITRANQVWCTDITYIRLKHGFVYLVAIMDWNSRRILSWELSTTMDKEFCLSALERAMRIHGTPEIFNSDQGSQFTCKAFREKLEREGIRISMDGKGRAFDNIVIERFWRTLKYGEVYLKDYTNPIEAATGIGRYIEKYNSRRPHSSLGKRTPDEAFFGSSSVINSSWIGEENQTKIS
jgi:putative transposase